MPTLAEEVISNVTAVNMTTTPQSALQSTKPLNISDSVTVHNETSEGGGNTTTPEVSIINTLMPTEKGSSLALFSGHRKCSHFFFFLERK